jgi:hypothetical protein
MDRTHEYQIISDYSASDSNSARDTSGRGLAAYSDEHRSGKYWAASGIYRFREVHSSSLHKVVFFLP